jgi:hypothetical protein
MKGETLKASAFMTDQELETWNGRAARMMERVGGGFAKAISAAYLRADSDNRHRLLQAFPELFTDYRHLASDQDW